MAAGNRTERGCKNLQGQKRHGSMGTIWGREPALVISVLGAALNLLIAFGLHLTSEQISAISALELAAIGFVIRSQVAPTTTLRDNGIDPKKLLGVLLVVGLGVFSNTGCASTLLTRAAIANDKLATAARQVQISVDAAHDRDCEPSTPGLQRCLSDADYEKARQIFIKAATSGLALNDAIRAGDQQSALKQADAALAFVDQLLTGGVVKLPPDDQLIVTSVLQAARIALAAVAGGAK